MEIRTADQIRISDNAPLRVTIAGSVIDVMQQERRAKLSSKASARLCIRAECICIGRAKIWTSRLQKKYARPPRSIRRLSLALTSDLLGLLSYTTTPQPTKTPSTLTA